MGHHSAVIKERMARFLASKDFDPYFEELHVSSLFLWSIGIIAPLTVIGFPLAKAAWKRIRAGDSGSARLRRRYRRLGETGEVLFTRVLVANSGLMDAERADGPALVVGNFNQGRDDKQIATLTESLANDALGLSEDPARESVCELLEDLDYTFCRRRQIPAQFTGGIELTAFDLQILGKFLPTKSLQIEVIPCIAERGPRGLICMVPSFLMDDIDWTGKRR